ncbi:hypothetical protein FEZ48_12050 [Marinilactibacillus psychrotolerans]|uniref:Uncharacterized protein n=1 Tax=Marinilactibacillus psychrotolerans TaxID=191770 RepID=A0A5R9BXZ3_9LACT|nr:hypothetical protein FEZ48_12050 [Marinilactibacillus psychrotolerans]
MDKKKLSEITGIPNFLFFVILFLSAYIQTVISDVFSLNIFFSMIIFITLILLLHRITKLLYKLSK